MRIPPPAVPVRMRPATDNAIGTTAFFRNRPLFYTLLEEMSRLGRDSFDVRFHACSIGAEVYSFIICYFLGGYANKFILRCHASDREEKFLDIARQGTYPLEVLTGMTSEEAQYVDPIEKALQIQQRVRDVVDFLPPCDFTSDTPQKVYNVVFLLNALVYVPADRQATALANIASYNSDILVTTAFHADSIKSDLVRGGYVPVLRNIEEIHESWLDRRVVTSGSEIRSGIYAPWSLPPFSKLVDYEFKYCAIFEKQS